MNDRDEELFEAELQRLKPARPPEELITRLVAARPTKHVPLGARPRGIPQVRPWWWQLRWLAPAAAAATLVVTLFALRTAAPGTGSEVQPVGAPAGHAFKGSDVEIDRRLVAAYDAVAELPGGEPVRFRFSEWTDKVVLRDTDRGVEIEQSTPRVEVVPVGYEVF
jgi:hypothetical protein